ncbi:CBASS cGAMP-activated phospholipase [Rhabdochlamydiaceae symbiont of Dictyostelium giganteum]|uniref:CBASS cGAMP-activated phospholipase n=1 Tax=Rhabdochlamydiaceae symbiont of Dictyostelium giganteum TaxID=3342349 RepID=UPI00384FEAE9
MSIEVEEEHPFLDLDQTIFPHFKNLVTPSLRELYERVERARQKKMIAYTLGSAAAVASCALLATATYLPIAPLALVAISCFMYGKIQHKPKPYLILSIDGGGIRGIIPAQMLAHIERMVGCRIGSLFDCITGTSIGGVLALTLALPDPQNPRYPKKSARDMVHFFLNSGPAVFSNTTYERIKGIEGVRGPKYSNESLKNLLTQEFGETRLSEAVTDVLVPSYDLAKGKPLIFCHFKDDKTKKSFLMRDVGLGTTAAPVYFPSHSIQDNGHSLNLIDGGMIANNPSFLAFMKAAGHIEPGRDIFILSLGTGNATWKSISHEESKNFGAFQWLPMIFNLLFQTSEKMLTLHFKNMQYRDGKSFSMIRLQPSLDSPEQTVLDNTSRQNIINLNNIAIRYCAKNKEWIQKEIVEPLKKHGVSPLHEIEEFEEQHPIELDDYTATIYP